MKIEPLILFAGEFLALEAVLHVPMLYAARRERAGKITWTV